MSSLLPPEAGITVGVIGTAYLDEFIDVEGPLCPDGRTRIDYSRTEAGRAPLTEPGTPFLIESPGGDSIRVTDPAAESGLRITLAEDRILDAPGDAPPMQGEVALRGRRVLLGGMGAGYALAFGGRLVLPIGEDDAEGREMVRLLDAHGIAHRAVPVAGQVTDTTVLLWSSAGDKLPIGRRTASRAVAADALLAEREPADLTLVTSLPSATVAGLVAELDGWVMFTPSLRNVREGGLGEIAEHVDAIAMNRSRMARRRAGDRGAVPAGDGDARVGGRGRALPGRVRRAALDGGAGGAGAGDGRRQPRRRSVRRRLPVRTDRAPVAGGHAARPLQRRSRPRSGLAGLACSRA